MEGRGGGGEEREEGGGGGKERGSGRSEGEERGGGGRGEEGVQEEGGEHMTVKCSMPLHQGRVGAEEEVNRQRPAAFRIVLPLHATRGQVSKCHVFVGEIGQI